ncbi:SidA/IucD/PvdA family monooxygenase [Streptomyces demainii]|uniref:L-lysine N6-monooxygenase MbtG n=1 Tax=Streptomyces demainii TaxID=588122 RepID=A0ABT9KWV8_9ACTN|nr:SidA/IucD/PvdA family monooxygenase [Streptomyces demainii]MDP9612933.1 mycobactin lysine-N-oxygenase [Streptomyces demainii]
MIVERARIAEHWRAGGGRTTGRLRLGTPPEKDVGYPYPTDTWGWRSAAVNESMLGFTWARYLIEHGKFHRWVDRGRPHPLHEEWAGYITWVIKRSEAEVIRATVASVERDGSRWRVTLDSGVDQEALTVDGVVLTTTSPPTSGVANLNVLAEADFWMAPERFDGMSGQSVVVVGGGEGAAAALVELARRLGPESRLTVIAPTASIYTRAESSFENRLFTDPTSWSDLGEVERLEFMRRTDRGVFSGEAVALLADAGDVSFIPGRVTGWRPDGGQVHLCYEQDGRQLTIRTDWLVLCTNQSVNKELRVVDQAFLGSIFNQSTETLSRLAVARGIQHDLSIAEQAPGLHVPSLAGLAQGPGFPNLSCLGLLADRILSTYVADATVPAVVTRKDGFE